MSFTSLERIVNDPGALIGSQVNVRGDVNVVVNGTILSIADNTLLDLNEILVVTPNMEISAETLDGMQPVRVQGILQLVNADMLEDLADIDLQE